MKLTGSELGNTVKNGKQPDNKEELTSEYLIANRVFGAD
jgi:hypothetical protein